MEKAISKAKMQSVKDIKKKAKKKKRLKIIKNLGIAILILLALALLIYFFIIANEYQFSTKDQNITYLSKDFSVIDSLNIFSQKQDFLFVFNVFNKDSNNIKDITPNVVTFQSIFNGNDKNTTLLINILDNKRNIISCYTNKGESDNVYSLDGNACLSILDTNHSMIYVDYPNNSIDSKVYLNIEENFIYFKTDSFENLNKSMDLVLSNMFSNVQDITKKTEEIKNKLDQNILI